MTNNKDVKKPVFRNKPKVIKFHVTEENKIKFSKALKKNNITAQALLEEMALKYIEENNV